MFIAVGIIHYSAMQMSFIDEYKMWNFCKKNTRFQYT
jgi:hypothetical protein